MAKKNTKTAKPAKKATKAAVKKVVKPVAKKAAKPVAKKVVKAAPKKAAKPVAKKATKPVAKKVAKPAPKKVAKPIAKKTTKPVAKKAVKPVTKKVVKAVAKKVAKPVAKKATKPVAKKVVKVVPKKVVKPMVAKKVAKPAAKPAKKVIAPKKDVKPAVKAIATKPAAKPVLKPTSTAKTKKPEPIVEKKPIAKQEPEPYKPNIVKPTQSAIPIADPEINTGPSKRYSDKDLEIFRERINHKLSISREELNNLMDQLQNPGINAGDDADNSYKTMEDGSSTAEKEQIGQLAARLRKFIENLEHAMVRIENKTYGICRVTGNLISKERLFAVPHTTLSMEAKMQQYK
jgi:RNA polymerase-binding transcription factor DksA